MQIDLNQLTLLQTASHIELQQQCPLFIALQQPVANSGFSPVLIAVAAVLVLFLLALVLVFMVFLLGPWLRAFTSRLPLPIFRLIGMYLRRSPVKQIVDCGIMATHGKHPLSWDELERAAIQKVDLDLVTTAWIQSREDNIGLTWEEIIDAARKSRLESRMADRRRT